MNEEILRNSANDDTINKNLDSEKVNINSISVDYNAKGKDIIMDNILKNSSKNHENKIANKLSGLKENKMENLTLSDNGFVIGKIENTKKANKNNDYSIRTYLEEEQQQNKNARKNSENSQIEKEEIKNKYTFQNIEEIKKCNDSTEKEKKFYNNDEFIYNLKDNISTEDKKKEILMENYQDNKTNDNLSSEKEKIKNNSKDSSLENKEIHIITIRSLNQKETDSSVSVHKEWKKKNDSTNDLRAIKIKENLDEGKSLNGKTRFREDSILTDIQENLNDNYSSVTKFFNKESVNEEKEIESFKHSDSLSLKDEVTAPSTSDKIINKKLQFKQLLDKSLECKLLANDYFKKKKFHDAIREYINALEFLYIENTEIGKIEKILNMTNINMIKLECLNNIAVCSYLMKDYLNVLEKTNEVLAINSNNFNALCYRAKALIALNNTDEALKSIKQALSIKYNKTLYKYLNELEAKQRKISDEMILNKFQEQQNIINLTNKQKNYDKLKILNKNFLTNKKNEDENSMLDYNNDGNFLKKNSDNTEQKINYDSEKIGEEKSILHDKNELNVFRNDNDFKNLCLSDENRDKNLPIYSISRIFKLFKIILLYLIQYIKRHKSILCLLIMIYFFIKRKKIINLFKRLLGM